MKQIRLQHITAWLLLIIMSLIVVHAPLTVFIGSRFPGIADQVKAWKEIAMLAALLLVVFDYTRKRAWGKLTNDLLVWLIAVYAALHLLITAAYNLPANAEIAGILIDLRYVGYFLLIYMFLKLYPQYKQSFITIAIYGAALVVGFAVLQLVLPRDFLAYLGYGDSTIQPYITIDKNPTFVRGNSTLRGPNPLGAYAVIVVAAVAAYVTMKQKFWANKRVRNNILFFGIAGAVALFVSYSRSAWIGAVVAIGIILALRYRKQLTPRRLGLLAAVGLLVLAIGYAARDSYFISNVVLHNNPTTGAEIDSNMGHVDSLQTGIARIGMHPLGSGVGSTGSASLYTEDPIIIENQLLFIAHEVGWLGLALFIAINIVLLKRLWHNRTDWLTLAIFASGIGLFIVGLLLPVWADDTVAIVWWGIAAVVLVPGKVSKRGPTTNKKAKRTA